MGYRVLCDGYLLHDSNIQEYTLINPVLNLAINKSGEFKFQIAHNHPNISRILDMKSYIEIYEDNRWLWSGRPTNVNTSMKLYKTVTCEGELSFLHDSNQRLAEYHNISVRDYFADIIAKHNADVDTDKQFKVGEVNVIDPNDSLYRKHNYEDTFDLIQDKLIKRLGGYLVIRHEQDGRYIDYLKDYPGVSNQTIEFGSNIIDIAIKESSNKRISAIIPLGCKMQELDETADDRERLTITSVNGGLDYIVNEEAVRHIGLIKDVVIFDDVTIASNLLTKGSKALIDRLYANLTVDMSIFDKSFIDSNLDKFRLGATIIVNSQKHGIINRTMMINKMSINLSDITKTKIQTGFTEKTMTDSMVDVNQNFDGKVETIVNNAIVNENVTNIKPQLANINSRIDQTANQIKLEVSEQYLRTEEKDNLYKYVDSNITQTADKISFEFQQELAKGATKVKTSTGFSFDDNGLTISKSGSQMSTNLDEDGLDINKNGLTVLKVDHTGVKAANLHATTYLIVGLHSRFEDYEDGTGLFYIE